MNKYEIRQLSSRIFHCACAWWKVPELNCLTFICAKRITSCARRIYIKNMAATELHRE